MRTKAINMLWQNIDIITIGWSVIVFAIIGKIRFIVAVAFRIIATSLDMLFGYMKAKYITDTYDSRIFGRSIIKRWFILALGLFLTLVARHLTTFFDWLPMIIIWALPIWYFHLFTIQELSSMSEHGKDIDPDDRGIDMIHKWTWWLRSVITKQIEKRANKFVWIYDYLSPIHNKRHLKR